jgi:hypothetical protein
MNTWIVILTASAAGLGPVAAFLVARSSLISRRLPRRYLMPSGFEQWQSGRCYRWLGVRWFKYLFVVAVNLVVNGYPMMVQRYNRARLLPLVSGKVRERWRITEAMLARCPRRTPDGNRARAKAR